MAFSDKKKREIRVFISSTFSDMQKERDSLVRTFNFLRTEASKRGVSVTMVDLRWGITESEAAQGRIIDICLKEINHSKPFFIGIVGGKYGSIPPTGLSENTELAREYPGVIQGIKSGKSYTEIEMQYGVLDNPEKVDAFFYIKEGDGPDAENADKLESLKARIRQQKRYPVYSYSEPEEVAEQVRGDFLRILEERFPKDQLTMDGEARRRQAVYRDNLLDFYVDRRALQEKAESLILDGTGSLIHVTGLASSGKSALCAKLVEELSFRDDCRVSSFFARIGSADEELADVASYLLGRTVGYENAERAIMDAAKADDLTRVIVLDGLDALEIKSIRVHGPAWLSILPKNYKVVVSSTEGSPLYALVSSLEGVSTVTCSPLKEGEKAEFATTYLERYSKKLKPDQLARIVQAPITENPAILRALLGELTAFGYFERLDERIDEYVGKKDGEEFFRSILDRFEQDFGDQEAVSVLRALALSRQGLTEDEIERICGIRRIDLAILLGNCPSLVSIMSGFVCISNNRIGGIIRNLYSDEAADLEMRRRICDDFLQRCEGYEISFSQFDPFKKNFLYDDTARTIHEAAFQMHHLQDNAALYGFLIRPSIWEVLFRTDRAFLADCWKELEAKGHTLEALLDRVRSVDRNLAPVIFNDLGMFFSADLGHLELAKRCYDLCMESYDAHFGADSTRQMIQVAMLTNQAVAAYRADNYEQALPLFEKSLRLSLDVFESGSEENATAYFNVARIHKAMDHFDEAVHYYTEALKRMRRLHEGPHTDTADALYGMAYCHYMSNDDEKAIEAYSDAYEMYCALEGKDSENAILAQYGQGRSVFYTTDWLDSLAILNDALDKSIRTLGDKDDTTRWIYEMLGLFWERMYKTFHEDITLDRRLEYLENAAICFAHADRMEDAQRLVDLYNSLL